MTLAQRLELRRSEIRERLNDLNSKDTLTAEERTEEQGLIKEFRETEQRWRTAVEADDILNPSPNDRPDPDARQDDPNASRVVTPESREWDQIVGRVQLRSYLDAIMHERVVAGVEAEMQQELKLRSNEVPWEAIAPLSTPEERAVTLTGDAEAKINNQIIARVFNRSATAYLGVMMPMVGVGETNYPIITSGAAAEQKVAGDKVNDGTLALTGNVISPIRLTVRYTWQREQAAKVGGLEAAIRNDMSMAMSDAMDVQVLTGDGTAPNVAGFLSELDDPTAAMAEESFLTYNSKSVAFVDGKYAVDFMGVRQVVGPDTYRHMASKFLGDNPVNAESAAAYLGRVSGGVFSSANMAAVASKKQNAIVARNSIESGHAYAPVWQGVSFIRDEITKADSGEIALTAIALWGFKIVREAAYARVDYQVTA